MSECGCLYMGDGEPIDLSQDRVIVARKEHACYECRRVIARGERHELVTGRCEGEWVSYRTCLVCVEIRSALSCDGWVYGWLWQSVHEMFAESAPAFPSGCIDKLETVAAKERMAAEWRASVGLAASGDS